MVQVVQPHLEASGPQVGDQVPVQPVALGHEVEGRPESEPLLDVGHRRHQGLAGRRLDVMREHQRPPPPLRPEVQERRGLDAPLRQNPGQGGAEEVHVPVLDRPVEAERTG